MLYKNWGKAGVAGTIMLIVTGCAQQPAMSLNKESLVTPENWVTDQTVNQGELKADWLNEALSNPLRQAIDTALENNLGFKQQQLQLQASKQAAIASGANLWPSLDLGFSSTVRESSNSNSLGFTLRYEIDLWGKLSAQDRQVNLQLAAAEAELEKTKQELVRDVVLAWYKAVEAKMQLELNQKRLANTNQNLAIIESGYESGLNSALDVYLTRNEVANENARVANQQNAYIVALRDLELLIGDYPAGLIAVNASDIPAIKAPIQGGVPAEMVKLKPALKISWFNLMAKDAGAAYAHKQRFPSFSLSSNAGLSSAELGDLLSSDFAWSLTANITQPIFQAGRLAANAEKAKIETQQAEQAYLQTLNNSFAEVENRLTKAQTLNISFQANQLASENAELALELSFEQYLKGLVSYTTVLDAQTRAFNAKSAMISAKYQLLENRLQLHSAFGGDFNSIFLSGSN